MLGDDTYINICVVFEFLLHFMLYNILYIFSDVHRLQKAQCKKLVCGVIGGPVSCTRNGLVIVHLKK